MRSGTGTRPRSIAGMTWRVGPLYRKDFDKYTKYFFVFCTTQVVLVTISSHLLDHHDDAPDGHAHGNE